MINRAAEIEPLLRQTMEPFLTKLSCVCVMKRTNEALSGLRQTTAFLSNPISAQRLRSTKGAELELDLQPCPAGGGMGYTLDESTQVITWILIL